MVLTAVDSKLLSVVQALGLHQVQLTPILSNSGILVLLDCSVLNLVTEAHMLDMHTAHHPVLQLVTQTP